MTPTTTALAWHGDPNLKTMAVTRMREHAKTDRLIRGTFVSAEGDLWSGCLHGCLTAETVATEMGVTPLELPYLEWHEESERLWGIPRTLGRLLDHLYESSATPPGELAVAILDAIPVGADLTPVLDRLMVDLLSDPEWGVRQHTQADSPQQAAVDRVAWLYARRLDGQEPARGEWAAAEADAAWAATAACATAWAAATATATAAGATAWAAATAAATAAGATAWAAAEAAAWGWWTWWQQRVLHHLTNAPTDTCPECGSPAPRDEDGLLVCLAGAR